MQIWPVTLRKGAIFFFCIVFSFAVSACASSSTDSDSGTDSEASTAGTGTDDGSSDGSDDGSSDGSDDGSSDGSDDGTDDASTDDDDGSTDDPAGFQGSCVEDGEEAFMAALGAEGGPGPLQNCLGSCTGQEQPGECFGACMEENTGLSEDCLACFGDFSGCVGMECTSECGQTGAPEDCEVCINTSGCLAQLFECSDLDLADGPGPGPTGQGACMNADDLAALDAMKNSDDDMFETCGETCFADDDATECATDCFAGLMETSEECSACFGAFMGCIIDECPECTSGPESAECDTCVESLCNTGFVECAGFELGGNNEDVDEGACTNPQDADAVEAFGTAEGENPLDACTESCMGGEDDIEDCVVECLGNDAGVSEDCAGCFGGILMCLADNCEEECSDNDGDDADENDNCSQCLSDNGCFSDFEDCAGISLWGDSGDGACLNADDQEKLQEKIDEIGIATFDECSESCAEADNVGTCAAECFADNVDTSEQCSSCFGEVLECALDVCSDECADGMNEECQMCSDNFCGEEFEECAGFALGEDDEEGGDGACNNWEDKDIIDATMAVGEGEGSPLEICSASCASEQDDFIGCVGDCIEEYTGMSGECATCFGIILEAVVQNCPECLSGQDEDACNSCMEAENVGEQFHECAGIYLGQNGGVIDEGDGGEGPGPEDWGDGACMNEGDMGFLDSMDDGGDGDGCIKTCFEGANGSDDSTPVSECVVECLVTEEGVSEDCAACFGEMMACLALECEAECMAGEDSQSSPDCDTCLEATCQPAFMSCAGLPEGSNEGDGSEGPPPSPGND